MNKVKKIKSSKSLIGGLLLTVGLIFILVGFDKNQFGYSFPGGLFALSGIVVQFLENKNKSFGKKTWIIGNGIMMLGVLIASVQTSIYGSQDLPYLGILVTVLGLALIFSGFFELFNYGSSKK